MGTTYNITLVNPPQNIQKQALQNDIDSSLLTINQLMSTYISDSELSRFNQSPPNEWFQLSEDTFNVIQYSLNLSKLTVGKFDVTIGPLINLWGFGATERVDFPSDDIIEIAKEKIGWQSITLNTESLQIKKNKALSIDLSAVAKGYGVDKIAELLEDNEVDNYLVEIGGEIRVKGVNKNNQLWKIGIETPSLGQLGAQKVVAIDNMAVATSGDYRNFFEKDGVRYSHTIDPDTGKPVTHNIASITVLSKTAKEADALATALMVMGESKALDFAKVYNIPVYILLYDGDAYTALYSPSFDSYLNNVD